MTRRRPAFARSAVAVVAAGILLAAAGAEANSAVPPRLTGPGRFQLSAISFFIAVLLACAGVLQLVWHILRADAERLPRLTYARSLGLVLLWGVVAAGIVMLITGGPGPLSLGTWVGDGQVDLAAPGARLPARVSATAPATRPATAQPREGCRP